jgi:chromosome segregation ATPase
MRKRKKGVSLDEKRERILKIYHETLDVFNLKEIEKLGSKAGVVLQTIKDVNQALVDDNLVDTDKIGSGNYFWSFPSKVAQQRKRKLEEIECRREELKSKIQSTKDKIAKEKGLRNESDERVERLNRLASLKSDTEELKQKVYHLKENDPDILKKLGTCYWCHGMHDGACCRI